MMLVPYVCCGDPSIEFTKKLVKALAPHSYAIELGIPFSDPIADGKTIQEAAMRSLKNGTTIAHIFGMIKELRHEGIKNPLIFMTYYNIAYSYGQESFLNRMKESGMQGIIIPDLPLGEDEMFEKLARKHRISMIYLLAPNTAATRAKQIISKSKPFTYLVSLAGVTGARSMISEESISFVKRMRKLAGNDKKLLVGFGISSPGHAKQLATAGADGVIVGSKITDTYRSTTQEKALKEIKNFAEEISRA